MNNNQWFKKEAPLQGLTGLWGGVMGALTGGAGGPIPFSGTAYNASGGTESTANEAVPSAMGDFQLSYKTHKFFSGNPSTFSVSQKGSGTHGETIELLVVGGGGGGGVLGGGGGGGGVLYGIAPTGLPSTNYSIDIGQGGVGDYGWSPSRSNGQASTFSPGNSYECKAWGGGHGASYNSPFTQSGQVAIGGGDSHHGNGKDNNAANQFGTGWQNGAPALGNPFAGSGFAGGDGDPGCCPCTGGGGGGAGQAGSNSFNAVTKAPGGNGFGPANIFGGSDDYIGGGGGNTGYCGGQPSDNGVLGGNGGKGGGGGGASQSSNAPDHGQSGGQVIGGFTTPAASGYQGASGGTGTGGGGGGGAAGSQQPTVRGGNGGSGSIFIRYAIGDAT